MDTSVDTRTERCWAILQRAGVRFRRRRKAWLEATAEERDFNKRLDHPLWKLVEEANRLLLSLGK